MNAVLRSNQIKSLSMTTSELKFHGDSGFACVTQCETISVTHLQCILMTWTASPESGVSLKLREKSKQQNSTEEEQVHVNFPECWIERNGWSLHCCGTKIKFEG